METSESFVESLGAEILRDQLHLGILQHMIYESQYLALISAHKFGIQFGIALLNKLDQLGIRHGGCGPPRHRTSFPG
ncbi:hypothetical protein D3C73_1268100 [compost metagenome]